MQFSIASKKKNAVQGTEKTAEKGKKKGKLLLFPLCRRKYSIFNFHLAAQKLASENKGREKSAKRMREGETNSIIYEYCYFLLTLYNSIEVRSSKFSFSSDQP